METFRIYQLIPQGEGITFSCDVTQPAGPRDDGMARYHLQPGLYEVTLGNQRQMLYCPFPQTLLVIDTPDKCRLYIPFWGAPAWEKDAAWHQV